MRDESKSGGAGGTELPPQHDPADIYEMFIAELEGRRERLDQLLKMLTLEANRHSRTRFPLSARARCKRAAARIS